MNILFPIETISRELDYKLVLAFFLAGKNKRKIHFGSYQFLDKVINGFQNGLYVGKNVFRNDARKFTPKGYYAQKRQGVDTIYYYEEGGFFYNDDALWVERLEFSCNPRLLDEKDYVFVWGEKQKEFLMSIAKVPANVKNIGVVRFDLYSRFRYLYESPLKGKYILVNTHNGFSNNQNAFEKFTSFYNFSGMSISDRIEFLKKYNYDSDNLNAIVQLVLKITDMFPNETIVIRPHPSENLNYYAILFKNVSNVKVVRQGTVGDWLVGAKALIHGGCTTSFEAHFSGVPVITYIKDNGIYAIYPANSIGYVTNEEHEALDILSLILNQEKVMQKDYQVNGNEIINNLNTSAFECFLHEFEKAETLYLANVQSFLSPSFVQIYAQYFRDKSFKFLYSVYNRVLGRSTKLTSLKYQKNKFPGFEKQYIENFLKKLEHQEGKKVKLNYYNSSYFTIE